MRESEEIIELPRGSQLTIEELEAMKLFEETITKQQARAIIDMLDTLIESTERKI